MIILVDFENTHASGMEGYQYLNETDTVVMYYSDENSAITKGMVDDLKERNVNVRMVKLLKQHSNALDMYIASTTGMFLDSGEKICIVSKDKGYAAVKDFWHSLRNAEILLGETIEECFLHSVANDEERIRNAKERQQKALLTDSFETMNKIPTRPTLSRYSYRRRRNILDTTRNLDPVKILPNPLWNPNLQDGEPDEEDEAAQERGAGVEARADAGAAAESQAAAVAAENAVGSQKDKDPGREQGRTRQNGRGRRGRRQDAAAREEAKGDAEAQAEARENAAKAGQDIGTEPDIEAVFPAEAAGAEDAPFLTQETRDAEPGEDNAPQSRPGEGVREEKKQGGRQSRSRSKELFSNISSAASANDVDSVHRVIPRVNPNQVQYIYDPATGQMKKVEMEVAGKAAPIGAGAEIADAAPLEEAPALEETDTGMGIGVGMGADAAMPEDAGYALSGEGGDIFSEIFEALPMEDAGGLAPEDAPAAFPGGAEEPGNASAMGSAYDLSYSAAAALPEEEASEQAGMAGNPFFPETDPGLSGGAGTGNFLGAAQDADFKENALADPAAQAGAENAGSGDDGETLMEEEAEAPASFSQFVGLGADTESEDAAADSDSPLDSASPADAETSAADSDISAAAEGGIEGKPGNTDSADSMESSMEASSIETEKPETEKSARKKRTGKRRGRKAAQAEAEEDAEASAFSEGAAEEMPLADADSPSDSADLSQDLVNPDLSELSEAALGDADAPEDAPADSAPKAAELDAEAISELIEKYGSSSNTLHQYYLKIMKAYGKAEGKPIYDASKKAMQAEIKRRKAAE